MFPFYSWGSEAPSCSDLPKVTKEVAQQGLNPALLSPVKWLSHKATHHLTNTFPDGGKLMQVGRGKAEVFSKAGQSGRDLGKDGPMLLSHVQIRS